VVLVSDLPLAKAMTELHGGSLSLESEFGKGTTVTIELPEERHKPPEKDVRKPRNAIQALVEKARSG
jgi:hypothetical protein